MSIPLSLSPVPGPVSGLSWETVNDTSATVSWKEPNDPNGKIVGYAITITNRDDIEEEPQKFEVSEAGAYVFTVFSELH